VQSFYRVAEALATTWANGTVAQRISSDREVHVSPLYLLTPKVIETTCEIG